MQFLAVEAATGMRSQDKTGFEILVDAASCTQSRVGLLVDQAAFFEWDYNLLVLEIFRIEIDDVHIVYLNRIADGRRVGNTHD
jgi:hypothetical protein